MHEIVSRVSLLKRGRHVQSFGNLAKTLCVHAFLTICLVLPDRRLHLSFELLLASFKLFSVDNDLVLLIDHLSLEFADLTLEDLHLFSP